jgi:hypothetical protein
VHQRIEFVRDRQDGHVLFEFQGLKLKTDRFDRRDRWRIIFLGDACGIVMNYLVHNPGMVEGKTVFEPFAGSGPMGYFALKQGAPKADFLDINPRAIEFLRINAGMNGFMDAQVGIHRGDIHTFTPGRNVRSRVCQPSVHASPGNVRGNNPFRWRFRWVSANRSDDQKAGGFLEAVG